MRLHFLGAGGPVDMHSPMTHGRLATVSSAADGARVAAIDVYPGSSRSVDVALDTAGAYEIECAVNDHWAAGMKALLVVE